MTKINLKNYVAKNAKMLAEAKIKWFAICITKYENLYLVTIVSALSPNQPIIKVFDNITDANKFFGKTIYSISI